MMEKQEKWKKDAAEEAAELVEDDMAVGLGSGTTLAKVVKKLGEKKSKADFVAASTATQRLVEKMNLNLISLGETTELDITIDGADEVNPDFDMIKGGGGAHTRERIVASAAREVAIVVDKTKLVKKLGEKNPVPVEIVPFAHEYITNILEDFGKEATLRRSMSGELYITDNGNYIADIKTSRIDNPEKLKNKLDQVPGTIDSGIFTNIADKLFVGYEKGCETLKTKKEFQNFSSKT